MRFELFLKHFFFLSHFQEEDDEDDEPEVKVTALTVKPNVDWPQAPQFIDLTLAPATSKQVETLSTRMNQMIGEKTLMRNFDSNAKHLNLQKSWSSNRATSQNCAMKFTA